MKAIVLNEDDRFELRDVPKPVISDEDILIEVKACGICGSDVLRDKGGIFRWTKDIITMGHEFAGIVVEKGSQVKSKFNVGDRVVSDNTASACGTCYSCSNGHFVACPEREVLGGGVNGGFAKYVKIPGDLLKIYPNCLWSIPTNVSFEEATLMDPIANGYNAVVQQAGFRSGETIVIYGCGALGLMALQQATIAGATKAIMIGLSQDKKHAFEVAKKYGATHLIASDEESDLVGKIEEICGKNGVAVCIDAVGVPLITEQAIKFVRNEGTIVRIGLSPQKFDGALDDIAMKNLKLIGHMGYDQESWRNSLALAEVGKIDMKTIITAVLPLSKFREGIDMMVTREATKVVLVPEE